MPKIVFTNSINTTTNTAITTAITVIHDHHQGGFAHLRGRLCVQKHHLELRHFWI